MSLFLGAQHQEDGVVDAERDEEQDGVQRRVQVHSREAEDMGRDEGAGADGCPRRQGRSKQQDHRRHQGTQHHDEDEQHSEEDQRDDYLHIVQRACFGVNDLRCLTTNNDAAGRVVANVLHGGGGCCVGSVDRECRLFPGAVRVWDGFAE